MLFRSVDVPGGMREQFRNPPPRVAMLAETPGGLHHPLGRAPLPGVGDGARVIKWHLRAIAGGQQRLVVERVDLTGTSLHEQEDDSLRPGGVVGQVPLGHRRACRSPRGQSLGREGSKPTGRVPQPNSPRMGLHAHQCTLGRDQTEIVGASCHTRFARLPQTWVRRPQASRRGGERLGRVKVAEGSGSGHSGGKARAWRFRGRIGPERRLVDVAQNVPRPHWNPTNLLPSYGVRYTGAWGDAARGSTRRTQFQFR